MTRPPTILVVSSAVCAGIISLLLFVSTPSLLQKIASGTLFTKVPQGSEHLTAAVIGDSNSVFFKTHTDTIPNFAYNPTVKSKQSGPWSAPGTWSTGSVPSPNDTVLISHAITYDSTSGDVDTIGIDSGGVLAFKTDQNTKLKAGTIFVMPQGTLRIGTKANPLPPNYTVEIVIKNKPLDTTDDKVGVYDPVQWGTGLIALDGTVEIFGSVKSPTFTRLSKEPKNGDITLELSEAPSGWQEGDKLLLPDTKTITDLNFFKYHGEELAIKSINGKIVTLQNPIAFDHKGARDADNNLRFLPHVANLSRNIVIRSEYPTSIRGHVAFLHRSAVDVEYALFKDLGRTRAVDDINNTVIKDGIPVIGTNQIGRYPMHTHHLYGPQNLPDSEPQFKLIGNAVEGSPKFGLALHGSHYGLVQYNVIYDAVGVGIVTEDGTESYNTITDNFTMKNVGSQFPRISERYIFTMLRNGSKANIGHEGAGFWFRAGNNYIRNNVATNGYSSGFAYGQELLLKPLKIPAFKGANPHVDGESRMLPVTEPVLEFSNNEAYGAMQNGIGIWSTGIGANQNIDGRPPQVQGLPSPESVFRDFKTWHVRRGALVTSANRAKLENFVIIAEAKGGYKIYGIVGEADTEFNGMSIVNPDIQKTDKGIEVPSFVNTTGAVNEMLIEGGKLRNIVNINISPTRRSMHLPQTPRKTVVRNVRFESLTPQTRNIKTSIILENRHLTMKDEIVVENYNNQAGKNFRVYFLEQAPDFVVPKTGNLFNPARINEELKFDGTVAAPEEGLTNAQLFAKHGMAFAGQVAPCTDKTTYPEIIGFVCSEK